MRSQFHPTALWYGTILCYFPVRAVLLIIFPAGTSLFVIPCIILSPYALPELQYTPDLEPLLISSHIETFRVIENSP